MSKKHYSATRTNYTRDLLSALSRRAPTGLITVGAAAEALGVEPVVAGVRLRQLASQGWLARAQRGVYLIKPLSAAADVAIAEDPWQVADALFAPCYIGGWSAAEHWQLTEQLFRSTFVVSAAGRRRRSEVVLSSEFRVVRVPAARVESVPSLWRGPARIRVSSRERTIADALMHPGWLGGVRHVAEVMASYRESSSFRPLEILSELERLGSGAGIKRLGFLAERMWPGEVTVVERALQHRTKGIIRLDPGVARPGRTDSRWGMSINVVVDGGAT